MDSGILLKLKEEVTCPICLELLTEPLSLDCGHTFCQACITANNTESMVSKERKCICPVCRSSYQPGILRPNRHMANIAETLREIKLSPEEEQNIQLCKRHGEKLLLFCKEDEKLICWLCERSKKHHGHHILFMEEVMQEYEKNLQVPLDWLEEAEKLKAGIKEEETSWKNVIQNERQIVQDCFKNLRGILDSEEQKELQKLAKKEADILHDLKQSKSELVQQTQLLRDLMSELEHRLQGSTVKLLQDVDGIVERSKTFTLKKPQIVSKGQRRVFQAPNLSEMLQVFNELTDVRRYWDHITLNPPKDKQNVAISADRRKVRYMHCLDANKNTFALLGSPVITSGKHYWEVDVSEKQSWYLGVYGTKDSDTSSDQPKQCFWVIGLENQFEYNALGEYSSSDPFKSGLSLTVPPHRVGVFLDYDARTVSFYNVTNYGFLIYKFYSCSFSQEVYPYFCPMTCTGFMTLCSPCSQTLHPNPLCHASGFGST